MMRIIILTIFALLFAINEASASLYCVVDLSGRRCNYPDLVSCKQAAGEQGECVLNRQGMIAPVGGAPFCLVENWKTECVYRDRPSCQRQAAPRKAACIANPNLSNSQPSIPQPKTGSNWGSSQQQQKWNQQQTNPWEQKPSGGDYLPSPGYNPRPGSR